jgi:hypothetical protein
MGILRKEQGKIALLQGQEIAFTEKRQEILIGVIFSLG